MCPHILTTLNDGGTKDSRSDEESLQELLGIIPGWM